LIGEHSFEGKSKASAARRAHYRLRVLNGFATKACAIAYWLPCQFLTRIPSSQLLFLLQLKKSNQKKAARGQCSSSDYFVNKAGRLHLLPAMANSICIHANCPTEFTK
jgi:hypothetical protein